MLLVPPLLDTDLSLASFGDFPMASSLTPPVCTVDQDPAAMGSLAAERLLARSRGPLGDDSPTRTVLPVRLIHRGSCLRRGRTAS